MRSKILSLLMITGMTFGGAAFAGTTTAATTTAAPAVTAAKVAVAPVVIAGTIKSISTKGLYVTLTNGNRYHFAKGFSLSAFKVGEKVSVTFEMHGKKHMASAIKAA